MLARPLLPNKTSATVAALECKVGRIGVVVPCLEVRDEFRCPLHHVVFCALDTFCGLLEEGASKLDGSIGRREQR